MKKNVLLIFFAVFLTSVPAYAINNMQGMWSAWGYDGSKNSNGSAGDFIIAGGIGKGGQHGTWDDEWAVVGVIASTITERGGYFCPYQIQCNNKYRKRNVDTIYYWPTGFDYGKCAWLCESGYSGPNCLPQVSSPTSCDVIPYSPSSGGKFQGISLKTSGKGSNSKESLIYGFNSWSDSLEKESDVILGVVRFLEHGVIAAPVKVSCNRDNWPDNESFVDSVYAAVGTQKLLCASGYKANDAGNDCVPINADICETQNMTFCKNFQREKYNSSIHRLEESEEGCVKYFCSEPDTAFPSVNDTSCVTCAKGVKGGANTSNGVCVKCQTGEYFDQNINACRGAAAYSKTDMQYGKGQTKNTVELKDQCWTIVDPEDYADCVKGIKNDVTGSASDRSLISGNGQSITKLPGLNLSLTPSVIQQ